MRRMTYKELADTLASGEYVATGGTRYCPKGRIGAEGYDGDEPVAEGILIAKDDMVWKEPTVDLARPDTKTLKI